MDKGGSAPHEPSRSHQEALIVSQRAPSNQNLLLSMQWDGALRRHDAANTLASMLTDSPGPMPPDEQQRVRIALGSEIPTAPGERLHNVASVEILPAVQFELLLTKTTFLAGEALSPCLRVTNHSDHPLVLTRPRVSILTAAQLPSVFVPGAWPVSSPGPSRDTVAAGDWWAWRKAIQLPFDTPKLEVPAVQLQAVIQSTSPGPAGNSATWPIYRTPPVELTLSRPQAAQRLRVHFDADREQFSVRVTDANGAPVDGAVLVAWMLTYGSGKRLGQLREKSGSAWSDSWAPHLLAHNRPLKVKIWVAGPGYATGLAEAEVPSGLDDNLASSTPAPA